MLLLIGGWIDLGVRGDDQGEMFGVGVKGRWY